MKTNKSYSKRLKVTKNGKILARKKNQNHFNSKEGGRSKLSKKKMTSFNMTAKEKSRFISK